MKNIILFLIIFIFISTYSFGFDNEFSFNNKIEISSYYNSNILKLSEENIDEFKNNEKPDKYHIKSVDDIVTSFRCELALKHYIVAGHTQVDKIIFKYNKCWKNDLKDVKFVGAEVIQYFSKYFDISAKYFYFPYIYINHYYSLLDNEDMYRKFSYSKNVYRSGMNLKFVDLIHFGYQFEYSQNYYNKYFGEYDSDDFKHSFSITFFPYENIRMKFRYSYKHSLAEAEKVFGDITGLYEIRDASYESNIYYGSLTIPIRRGSFKSNFKLFTSFEFEERFFQSKYSQTIDPYHSGRKDNIFSFETSLIYPIFYIFDLKGFYMYETRNVSAPAGSFVEDEKEYSVKKVGCLLMIRF